MSKKKIILRKSVEQALPKAANQPQNPTTLFVRGREEAQKFTASFGWNELAYALNGFKSGVLEELRKRQANLDRAEEAINS